MSIRLYKKAQSRAGAWQVVEATTANGLCTLRVKALPLPAQLASMLDNHKDLLSKTDAGRRDQGSCPPESQQVKQQHSSSAPEGAQGAAAHHRKSADIGQLRARLLAAAKEAGTGFEDLFRRAWMLGPRRVSSPWDVSLAFTGCYHPGFLRHASAVGCFWAAGGSLLMSQN